MKHYDKIERLYKVWGHAEGALQGLEECLKTINPDAAKHCGEIRRELEALSAEMESANLGFVVKDYSNNNEGCQPQVLVLPDEYDDLDKKDIKTSIHNGHIIIAHPKASPYIYRNGVWELIKSEGVVQ